MKIAIIGSKGIPARHGGYETFAEELSLILKENHNMLVVGDPTNNFKKNHFNNICIKNSKYLKSEKPLRFYHESLSIAHSWGAEACIMCGIGGVFSIPFYRNSSMKIYLNPDGLGFKREKWIWWKKVALKLQFIFAAYFVKNIICDSNGIKKFFADEYKREKNIFVAEYGSHSNELRPSNELKTLKEYELEKDKYYLIVSRLEPENNIMPIIQGYLKGRQIFPLIIVGNKNTPYSRKLQKLECANIRFIGGIYDKEKLSVIRFYCKAYFHGHSVGGTNPSLLEGMAAGNLIVAHNNIFNREVLNNKGYFFENEQDIDGILKEIESKDNNDIKNQYRIDNQSRVQHYYSWERIAHKYLTILKI